MPFSKGSCVMWTLTGHRPHMQSAFIVICARIHVGERASAMSRLHPHSEVFHPVVKHGRGTGHAKGRVGWGPGCGRSGRGNCLMWLPHPNLLPREHASSMRRRHTSPPSHRTPKSQQDSLQLPANLWTRSMDQMNVSIIISTCVNYVIRLIPDIASINDEKIIIYFINVMLFSEFHGPYAHGDHWKRPYPTFLSCQRHA